MKLIKDELGIQFEVYNNNPDFVKEENQTALQVGTELELDKAKPIIRIARGFYPRLEMRNVVLRNEGRLSFFDITGQT